MTKKLLIIEDDKVLNEMYALKFKKEGYEVESAFEWIDWLTKVAEFNPDVILLDLMMPSMNGFETLESIKHQTSSECKIIIFTNVVKKKKIKKKKEKEENDYLNKADTKPKIEVEKVNEILEKENKEPKTPIYIKPGLNIFKMKNPLIEWWEDIEISINIKI